MPSTVYDWDTCIEQSTCSNKSTMCCIPCPSPECSQSSAKPRNRSYVFLYIIVWGVPQAKLTKHSRLHRGTYISFTWLLCKVCKHLFPTVELFREWTSVNTHQNSSVMVLENVSQCEMAISILQSLWNVLAIHVAGDYPPTCTVIKVPL